MQPGAVLTLAAALITGAAVPAAAAPGNAGLTPVMCTILAGGLSLSQQAGVTTVVDHRGSIGGWTTSIAMLGPGKGSAYIAVGDGPTVTSGSASPTTPYRTSATALMLSTTPQPLVTATTSGSNTVTYAATVVGVGSAGVAQSVS